MRVLKLRQNQQKVALIAVSGICISMLISNGFFIQRAFLTPFRLNAIGLYEAAYGSSTIVFPTFYQWVFSSLSPTYLLAALVVSSISTFARDYRQYLVAVAVLVAAALIMIDFWHLSFSDPFSSAQWVENIVSNLSGGVAVAFFFALVNGVCPTWLRAGKPLEGRLLVRYLVTVFLSALLVSSTVFFTLSLVHRPIESSMSISVYDQNSAYIADSADGTVSDANTSFSFLSADTQHDSTNFVGDGDMEFEWSKTVTEDKYSLEIRFFSGCASFADIDTQFLEAPQFAKDDVNKVSINLSSGSGRYSLHGKQYFDQVRTQRPVLFWLNRSGDTEKASVTNFLSGAEGSSVRTQIDGSFDMFLTGSFEIKDGQLDLTSAIGFTAVVDGVTHSPTFSASKETDPRKEIECAAVKASNDIEATEVTSLVLNTLMRFTLDETRPGTFGTRDSMLEAHLNGWFEWIGVRLQDLISASTEEIDFFMFRSPINSLVVGGKNIENIDNAVVYGLGEFKSEIVEGGTILVRGSTRYLYADGTRLVSTRWESWGWDVKGLLLGLCAILINGVGSLTKRALRTWRENPTLSW